MTKDTPTKQRIDALKADPSTSFWLKRALNDLNNRDPLDAYNDVHLLKIVFEQKLLECLGSDQ